MMSCRTLLVVIAGALLTLPACVGGKVSRGYNIETGGDAARGKQLITQYRCGSCHWIPGIASAQGLVGPPLMMFARRTFIAGELPNTPENLEKWIENPPSVEPHTAMPNLGVGDEQARDIAAYLYTLR
jgi:cytochrome c